MVVSLAMQKLSRSEVAAISPVWFLFVQHFASSREKKTTFHYKIRVDGVSLVQPCWLPCCQDFKTK